MTYSKTILIYPSLLCICLLLVNIDVMGSDLQELTDSQLDQMRGGTEVNLNNLQEQVINLTNVDITTEEMTTGVISIGEEFLNNLSGISSIINNTGNANAINSSIGINIYFQ